MQLKCLLSLVVGAVVFAVIPNAVMAQAVSVTGSSTAVRSGFSERIGVGFGFNSRNFSLNFGRGGRGLNPGRFGRGLPGTSINIPFGSGRGGLSIFAGQGYTYSHSSVAQSLTLTPGVPAFMFSGTLDPFVTQLTPVVNSPAGSAITPRPGSTVREMLRRGDIVVEDDGTGRKSLTIRATSAQKPKPGIQVKKESNPFLDSLKQYSQDK